MSVKVTTVVSQLPKYSRETADVLPLLDVWLADQEERYRRKARKIFENAGVDKRYSIMNPEEVFTATSLLDQSGLDAKEIDYIISVSCTGIMIPSIDAYLINTLGMRQDIVRLPVTEMGCVAGVSAFIYANNFLKANPNKRALIIAIESPTSTFQYHFFDAEHMMGFELTNTGLQMVLDKEVPDKIAEHFPMIVYPFLEDNGLSIDDVDHLIFHPGGKKIVNTIQELFGALGKDINNTKEILREYGNMSSATVLYVLERFISQKPNKGDVGLMLSFGPGFTAQRILLRW